MILSFFIYFSFPTTACSALVVSCPSAGFRAGPGPFAVAPSCPPAAPHGSAALPFVCVKLIGRGILFSSAAVEMSVTPLLLLSLGGCFERQTLGFELLAVLCATQIFFPPRVQSNVDQLHEIIRVPVRLLVL